MSNSADDATRIYFMSPLGGKKKMYDSPTPSFKRDDTSTNNQPPVREDGPEPVQQEAAAAPAPPPSPPITTTSVPAANIPENNDSEAGSLSSSTTLPVADALKTATTTSITKVTENKFEGGSQEQISSGESKEDGSSVTVLKIKTTTSLLVTTLENKDGSQELCASTTEMNETSTSSTVTAPQSNNSPSSTTTTADDVKTNGTTTSAATQKITVPIVTPIDKNPTLDKAVSDDSRINQALPTANDEGIPTESRVSRERESVKKTSQSSKTHTESQSPNLQNPIHQKMTPNSRPEEAANTSQQGEKLNKCCCCIYW